MAIGKIIFMMTPVDVDKVGFYWFLPPRFRGDYDILLSYSIGFERLHRPNSFAKMEFPLTLEFSGRVGSGRVG